MTNEERKLLLMTAKRVELLHQNRDDMLIGVIAALLDLYRTSFLGGRQTKAGAVSRLRVQRDELTREVAGRTGAEFLEFLAATLETDKLDAAKLLREPPMGTA